MIQQAPAAKAAQAPPEVQYRFVRTNSDHALKSQFDHRFDPLTGIAIKLVPTVLVGNRTLPGKDAQGNVRVETVPLVHIVAVLDEGTDEEEEVFVYEGRFKDDAERLYRTLTCKQTDEYTLNIKHKFHDRLCQMVADREDYDSTVYPIESCQIAQQEKEKAGEAK